MKRIAPEVEIIDITHGIQPHGVLQGAIVLANTLPYLPKGVHLAVVDPGVGSERRAIALRGGDGRLYVGPGQRAARSGGREARRDRGRARDHEPRVRARARLGDLPRARRLLAGGGAPRAGAGDRGARPGDRARLARRGSRCPSRTSRDRRIRACVPLRRPLREHAAEPDARATSSGSASSRARRSSSSSRSERYYAIAARTFADARDGEIILYEDAYENIAIAISGGSAAETFSPRSPAPTSGSGSRD